MHSYMLYLSPRDSVHLFPANSDKDFVVQFDKSIPLGPTCTVELVEFKCWSDKPVRRTFYVLCDLCDNSIVRGLQAPVLRSVSMDGNKKRTALEFITSYPIGVNSLEARCCRVYLRGEDLGPLSFEVADVELTLRLRYHDNRDTPV